MKFGKNGVKKPLIFNEDFYLKLIKKYRYNPIDFKKIDFPLNNLNAKKLKRKFLCHHEGDLFVKNLKKGDKSIITTGFGLSGAPHVGSISQIFNIIELQKTGIKTQIVLGDIDSYNARNQELKVARDRVGLYKKFVSKLGYNLSSGVIRDQFSYLKIFRTAFIIAHYLSDSDFVRAEEDISYIYKEQKIYDNFSFPMKTSLLLMMADFIHLGLVEGYKNIMIILGIEEHKYVLLTKKILKKMGLKFHICAMYGKIIKGLNGYPKMSKSIEGSSINVLTPPEEYRKLLKDNRDVVRKPEDNVIYQMMEQVSYYSDKEIERIYKFCKRNDQKKWFAEIDVYAKMLDKILGKWSNAR